MMATTAAERQARHRAKKRAGLPTDGNRRRSLATRFWAKVDRRGPDECWPWLGAKNEHGYGVMRPETDSRNGPTLKAHRASLMLHGIDPTGRIVRHACDNPPCVNPAHLSLGTHHDNAMDREARGRGNQPRKVPRDAIETIRARAGAGEYHRIIASDYGVGRSTISHIVGGAK